MPKSRKSEDFDEFCLEAPKKGRFVGFLVIFLEFWGF
jgi:hypothetical protein